MNDESVNHDSHIDGLAFNGLAELLAARGDMVATKAAFVRYFQRGLRAGLALDKLMERLPSMFANANYSLDEGRKVIQMLKALNLREIGAQAGWNEGPDLNANKDNP